MSIPFSQNASHCFFHGIHLVLWGIIFYKDYWVLCHIRALKAGITKFGPTLSITLISIMLALTFIGAGN
jgi:hypothetical protein